MISAVGSTRVTLAGEVDDDGSTTVLGLVSGEEKMMRVAPIASLLGGARR